MDNAPALDLLAPLCPTRFGYFYPLHCECFLTDLNMVISAASTERVKSALIDICLMRIFSKFKGIKSINLKGTSKMIYVAPSNDLVQEKGLVWKLKFEQLGVKCLELTGDNEKYSDADIILTTPEKFDAIIKDGELGCDHIALVLLDEVNPSASRICKSEMKPPSPLAHVRFVAISATIPNINDPAEWLMVPREGIKRHDEEMRPVKLTAKVLGYTPAENDILFEKQLQRNVFDILKQHSGGKSALVFYPTEEGAQGAAHQLTHSAEDHHSNLFTKSMEHKES